MEDGGEDCAYSKKTLLTGQPSYIHNLSPSLRNVHQHANWLITISCRSKYFKNFLNSYNAANE